MNRAKWYSCATLGMTALLAVWAATSTNAAEVKLAGVRLNQRVIELLTMNGWGQPAGIGPLAEISMVTSSAQPAEANGTIAGYLVERQDPGSPCPPADFLNRESDCGGTCDMADEYHFGT